jgi:Gpi18-like mannosyltransferase
MLKFRKISSETLSIILILFVGFMIRMYFVDKYIDVSGDLLLYGEWGEKFWELGSKHYYLAEGWYYAPPNYPPIINLIYAAAYWLYERRYILAEIHNATKLIPSDFIVYFGRIDPLNPLQHGVGYYLLLKLPGILADLGLGILVYKVIFKITKNWNKAMAGLSLYIFNPVTVLLSSVWGQTDSLVALFALLSFIFLLNKKTVLSVIFYFISLYTKPNWVYLAPLYLYLVYKNKPRFKELVFAVVTVFVIFYFTSIPFAQGNIFEFGGWLISNRLLATAAVSEKLSISAFNLYGIFTVLDATGKNITFLEIQAKILAYLIFAVLTYWTINRYAKLKRGILPLMTAIFAIAFSVYLFLPSMLARYFFPAFVPLLIVGFAKPENLLYAVLINISLFSNVLYAFFRRRFGQVADFFIAQNFLLIRFFSLVNLVGWAILLKNQLFLFQKK